MVERDAESDVDLPTGNTDFLDHQPQQALALFEFESVDALPDALGESGEPAPQTVGAPELAALGGERLSLSLELSTACGKLALAALQFGEVDEAELIEVDEASTLQIGLLEASS